MKYRFIVHARDNEGTEELYVSTVIEDTGSVTAYPVDVRAILIDELEPAKAALQVMNVDIQTVLDYETENGL